MNNLFELYCQYWIKRFTETGDRMVSIIPIMLAGCGMNMLESGHQLLMWATAINYSVYQVGIRISDIY